MERLQVGEDEVGICNLDGALGQWADVSEAECEAERLIRRRGKR